MERIRRGDQESLRVVLERYWSSLVRYAAGIVDDADLAQDVVQRTFIRVWRRRADWTPTGTVSGYLYRITRNLALNSRRDRRLRREKHESATDSGTRRASPRTPQQEFEAGSLEAEVQAAVAALSPRRREIFRLSRFHGLTHREIADALGISAQTVSNQMSAALAELREALSHHLTDG